MINIVVALPKIEEAKGIRSILIKNGFTAVVVCTTGAQALSQVDEWNDGIVICSYKLTDMLYSELHGCLSDGIDMLLIASRNVVSDCDLPMSKYSIHLIAWISSVYHTKKFRRQKLFRYSLISQSVT